MSDEHTRVCCPHSAHPTVYSEEPRKHRLTEAVVELQVATHKLGCRIPLQWGSILMLICHRSYACVYIYIHTYVYIYIYIYMYVYVYLHAYAYAYAYAYMYTYIYMYMCVVRY